MGSKASWKGITGTGIVAALALITLAGLAGCRDEKGSLEIVGSTTVRPLAIRMADIYMSRHPGVTITVEGGGSSEGIEAVAAGDADIGMASRGLRPSDPALHVVPVAKDAIAIIVHPTNGVDDVSLEEAGALFSGDIGNWKGLGGADEKVTVIAREKGSGTRSAFEAIVLAPGDRSLTGSAVLKDSNPAVKHVVSGETTAVGYITFGNIDGTVKALTVDGVECTVENARSGEYPVVHPLNLLTRGEPEALAKKFIDFCTSREAQEIVEKVGYIGL